LLLSTLGRVSEPYGVTLAAGPVVLGRYAPRDAQPTMTHEGGMPWHTLATSS
jgi:hypothetical protein